MNVNPEVRDYEAAGALADELPYWGWLDDNRTCLTRAGELVSMAQLSPSVLDGQTPKQLDRVVDRWQRMLSSADARTRLYFYLFRRAGRFTDDDPNASGVAAVGRRKRHAFLSERVQEINSYLAWCHDPGLRTVAGERTGGALVDGLCEELDGEEAEQKRIRIPLQKHPGGGGELPAVGRGRPGDGR